jgi:ubiquinone biosynthesis protein UbiJ
MSKSWDELKKNDKYRHIVELWYSRQIGSLSAYKKTGAALITDPEPTISMLNSITLDLASLREGLMAVENHLKSLEERLQKLEDLDEHR